MLDEHRVLIDGSDRLGNLAQIRAPRAAGYDGPFSFEPFSSAVHDRADPEVAIRTNMEHLVSRA